MSAALLLSAALLALAAQQPAPLPSPGAKPAEPATPTEYVVGAGDVLDIAVLDNEELTRTATVQTNGMITYPLLGEVPVGGLTVQEIRRKLTTLLAKDYLVNPQVEVRVSEYQSQFVIVLGEVNSPGRKALRGRTRLIDMLVDAGGIKPTASGDVTITRREGVFEGGADTIKLKLSGSRDMTAQDWINLEVVLVNGDLINVAAKQQVTVEGEVARPGRYTIDADTTITAAISLAGGLSRYGSDDVKIRRLDAATGKAEITDVDLKDIRNGKKPDVVLHPNDVITVPRRRF
jgi:polysaccharide export outer membrane protein